MTSPDSVPCPSKKVRAERAHLDRRDVRRYHLCRGEAGHTGPHACVSRHCEVQWEALVEMCSRCGYRRERGCPVCEAADPVDIDLNERARRY